MWSVIRDAAMWIVRALLIIALVAEPALAQMVSPLDAARQDQQQQQQQPSNGNQSQSSPQPPDQTPTGLPLLSPSTVGDQNPTTVVQLGDPAAARQSLLGQNGRMSNPPGPGEFERYLERVVGKKIPRFGADLLLPSARDFAVPATATVPPDYRINVGDIVSISMAGSIQGSVERQVDTNGNVFLPSVGQIHLAGVREGDLKDVLAKAIGTQYRHFRVGVRLSSLRGIHVFVTGFANNPGAFTLSGLATVSNAVLQAGGPSAGGSFRSVELIRDGHRIADFDLYKLLLHGSRADDPVLEDQDVLVIPPAGPQVAVIGSVHQEAIYELLPNETLGDALRLAGGRTSLAETDRAIVYRANPAYQPGPLEVPSGSLDRTDALPADILQVLPSGSLVQPTSRQAVIVRIEGEVEHPGNYFVASGTPLQKVVALAGGLTSRAFPFGTKLLRQSIVAQQREGYKEALDQFELSLATAPLTTSSGVNPDIQKAQLAGAKETLDQLRKAEPDGRLVLAIAPTATTLPGGLLLENGDRIEIPPRPTSVGVFGAVYRPASFELSGQPMKVKNYIEQAGGPIRAADKSHIFVVRASGAVLTRDRGAMDARVLPGDVIFVPVKTSSRSILDRIARFASIVFQFGLSAATVAAISR